MTSKLILVSVSWFSHSVVSDSLWPHGLQHARPPCPSPTSGACSNSCPSSQWCHPTILSSVVAFFYCLQSFPASESFPMSVDTQNIQGNISFSCELRWCWQREEKEPAFRKQKKISDLEILLKVEITNILRRFLSFLFGLYTFLLKVLYIFLPNSPYFFLQLANFRLPLSERNTCVPCN